MILLKVTSLSLSNMGFVVLLRGEQDPRTLPIFIGAAEAQAIAFHLDRVEVPRPLTHDLFKNVLDCLECRLKRVVITDLVEGTFYAVMVLERDGIETEVDARPSDSIALALRCAAPLYAMTKVMDQAGIQLPEGGEDGKQAGPASPEKATASSAESTTAAAIDRLQQQLEQAIGDEQYEEAARLRDEIKRLKQTPAKN
jgi:uncharacterized protein